MKRRLLCHCCSVLLLCLLLDNIYGLDPSTSIMKTSSVMDAVRGSTFELRCDVVNRPDGISTRWEREGTNCTSGQSPTSCRIVIAQDRLPNDQQKYGLKYQASDTYFLIIKNVDEKDEGDYYCQLPLTLYTKVYDVVRLRVVEPPSIDPLVTSSDKFVTIGDDVKLQCAAYGRPKPTITWTRAGNDMLPGGGFNRVAKELVIPNIQFESRGAYICTAKNDVGEVYRTVNINMNFAPQLTARRSIISQKVGYEVQLFCHVDSQPEVKLGDVGWIIGNKVVNAENSDQYRISDYKSAFSRIISKLTIYQVSRTDIDSEIRCVATNQEGTSSASFKITESDSVQPVRGASSSSNSLLITLSLLIFSGLGVLLY